MCKPVTCEVCGKTTWDGCGRHIEEVKATVPVDQWCDGNHDAEPAPLPPAA
ncbi:hypothetical protein HMPREF1531_01394 [Propionibacterium sp. oral taxon 192 str. F0372]|nr:hypothetical protein HMPREF1531_01394 [Propionibacterium sp. oral taxon 192 str. F0372]